MGKENKFKPRKSGTLKRDLGNLELRNGKRDPYIVLSFKDFDMTQGQLFSDWETEKLLALAVDKLRQVCGLTKNEATKSEIIKPYTKVGFPPNSEFTHPKHVPHDVIWNSMHIQGKPCVIGYFDDNIFFVVFLDKNHAFWPSHKKHT
jgi:hypothetical protein